MILPVPDPAFEWRQTPYGPALVCLPLEAAAPHFFTTRAWRLGQDRHAGDEVWGDVARACGVDPGALVRLTQVHGCATVVADAVPFEPDGFRSRPEADIVTTDQSGLAVAAQAADCVPLLIADGRRGVVAAAHAGWRGLTQGVPAVVVRAMATRYGSQPADLIAVIGPSVSACCYEVGPEVRDAFDAAFGEGVAGAWFHARPQPTARNPSMPGLHAPPRPGHGYFDGWASTRWQLVAAGVPDRAVFTAGLCPASHPDVLCSYRREGRAAGRMVGAIVRRA